MKRVARVAARSAARAKKALILKDIDGEVTREREASKRTAQNAGRMKEKLQARSSGKTQSARRQDPLQDRDIFQEIQWSLKRQAVVRLTAKTGGAVIVRRVPIYAPDWKAIEKADRREKRKHHIAGTMWEKWFWVPHWDHTGIFLKALSWAMALKDVEGVAVTLRLGDAVREAALGSNRGAASYLRDRIQRDLRREFAKLSLRTPDFMIALETSELGELHVHGLIELPDHVKALDAIRAALKVSGGRWRSRARQVDTPRKETPARWISYLSKWSVSSSDRIGGSTFAASNGLRTRGRYWYEEARTTDGSVLPGPSWHDYGTIPFCAL